MRFESLEPFSALVAKYFMEIYPQWKNFILNDSKRPSLVVVSVPSPIGGELAIWTNEHGEIFVGFDKYQSVLGFAEQTDEEVILEAQRFVERILQEEILVAVNLERGQWKYSKAIVPEEIGEIRADEFTYLRSWYGTYNREFQ